MKSPIGRDAKPDREPGGARDATSRRAAAVMLVLTTGCCFTLEGLGGCRAEAAPASAITEASGVSAAAVHHAVPAPPDTVDDRATMLLPNNASAEMRKLARDAMAGVANAENDLGTFFALGIEVPQSLDRAAYWYRRGADQGVANAAYNLGVLQMRGLGVPRDPDAALARFHQAAEAGHAGALNALGLAYLSGWGVVRDPVEALVWFRRASAAGNPRGAYNVARLYERGEIGPPDPATATGWYRVAADAGDAQAKEALARMQMLAGTGFVHLAPGVNLLALERAGTSDDRSDQILDELAARLAPPVPDSRAGVVEAPGPGMPGPQPAAARERLLTVAEIAEAQRLLTQMNLYAGRIDGRVRRGTRSAVAAFQRSHDLPVTGRPSASLLEALRATSLVAQTD